MSQKTPHSSDFAVRITVCKIMSNPLYKGSPNLVDDFRARERVGPRGNLLRYPYELGRRIVGSRSADGASLCCVCTLLQPGEDDGVA